MCACVCLCVCVSVSVSVSVSFCLLVKEYSPANILRSQTCDRHCCPRKMIADLRQVFNYVCIVFFFSFFFFFCLSYLRSRHYCCCCCCVYACFCLLFFYKSSDLFSVKDWVRLSAMCLGLCESIQEEEEEEEENERKFAYQWSAPGNHI